MKRLLQLLSLYRAFYGWMALGILASLITLIANVTLMAVSGWFIASMALAGVAQQSMNYFTPAAIIRGAAILRTGGRYVERLVTHEATLRLLAILRGWFYARLEPLAPAALQRYHSADLLSRIRADIDTLDNFYLRALVPAVTAVLATLIASLFLASRDGDLGLVLLTGLLVAGLGLPLLVLRLADRSGRAKQALLNAQRTLVVDSVQGMGELLQNGADGRYAGHLSANSAALASTQRRLAATDGVARAGLVLVAGGTTWLVIWLAVPLVVDGALPRAELAMLVLFTLATFEAVMPLVTAFQSYGETAAAAARLFEIVETRPAVADPVAPAAPPAGFDIRFERVGFRYPARSIPALHDFELVVPEGGRVTIVGPSGAGKSTLVQLLARFHDPDQGRIRLGGRDLRELDGETLRRCLGVLSQDAHVFTGSVRDNLLLGDPGADDAALWQACRIAHVDRLVASLPDGLDTWLGEAGTNLSGGERRRLLLARTLLRAAPVLVLDEPTEGLDATTAVAVLDAVDRWAGDRTVLLITHRVPTQVSFGPVVTLLPPTGQSAS
jgi:ATP-binding cassette subfamily C protein CydC